MAFGLWFRDQKEEFKDTTKKISLFICNRREKSCLGRNAVGWARVFIFYMFYFIVLGSIFAAALVVSLYIIGQEGSSWRCIEDSIIGTSPGVAFRPNLNIHAPLIWYNKRPEDMSYKSYVKEIKDFMNGYVAFDGNLHEKCDQDVYPKERSKTCYVNKGDLKDCADPDYGYDKNTPCIYFKLNKLYRWSPDCYNDSSELPEDMAKQVKEYIEAHKNDPKEMNTVWLSCVGYYPSDTSHAGELQYFPRPGFRAVYFPYTGQKNYMSPIVSVKFKNPLHNTLITVRCHLLAKNIKDEDIEVQLMIGDIP